MTLDQKALEAVAEITKRASQFQWYADEHRAAGKDEKAARNQEAAEALSAIAAALPDIFAAAERRGIERAAVVVQEARVGDRDNDLRSIIHGIRALSVDGEPTP